MSDTIITRVILGPAPPGNDWTENSLIKLTKPVIIGLVLDPVKYRENISESDTSDDDESTAGDKIGTTLVKLDPESPYYYIKSKCSDETNLKIRIIEMLRATIPPKLWEHEGNVYFQEALAQPITRIQVLQLKQKFKRWLKERQSTKYGLCAIRLEIVRQGLGEITRQSLMVAPERGLSLIRIKNEFELSLLAYGTVVSQAAGYIHVPDPKYKSDLGKLRLRNQELDDEMAQEKGKIQKLQELIRQKNIINSDAMQARECLHNDKKLQYERVITQLRLHQKALIKWGEEFADDQAGDGPKIAPNKK